MPKPATKGRHPSQYLNDLEEWGENQYSPGHWTGGKLPPHLKYARWPVVLFILLMALYTVIASLSALSSAFGPAIVSLLVAGVLLAGSLVWFFQHRRKRSGTKHRH